MKINKISILISTLIILITLLLLFLTFIYINKNYEKKLNFIETSEKKEAKDKKFGLLSYKDTYNENSLVIKRIEEGNINYIQISGLKNKEVQNKINTKIKDTVYKLKNKNVYTYLSGNFSNILSIVIESSGSFDAFETINVDLNTGNDIKLEDVFTSDSSINMFLADALYESMALNIEYNEDDDYYKYYDMNYRDTSLYEDKFWMIFNKYKEKKDNIKFAISPSSVYVYELTNGIIQNNFYGEEITINFINYLNNVAIYKRYLTKESLFENDKIGNKNVIVFTDNSIYNEEFNQKLITYKMVEDNLFIEEAIFDYEDSYKQKYMKDFIDKISSSKKSNIKKEIKENEGVIYQILYNIYKDEDLGYYIVYVSTSIAKSSKNYFKEEIFKDYIKMKNIKTGDAMMNMFDKYQQNDNLKIETTTDKYFIDFSGKELKNIKE